MKKLLLMAVLAIFSVNTFAQGIEFEHGSFEEALAKAKSEEKLLFVDFYTTWCGPCKKMSKDIFAQEKVGNYFNEKFVSLKVDAEKGEGVELAKLNKVNAYPTLLWFDGDGKEVKRYTGAFPTPQAFIDFSEQVLGRGESFNDLYAGYQKGNRELDFLQQLILKTNSHFGTLSREDGMKLYQEMKKVVEEYLELKPKQTLINTEDFSILNMYLGLNNNGHPAVEYLYDTYPQWKKVIPVKELSLYVVKVNNQSMTHSMLDGSLKFRTYVEYMNGRLAEAYQDFGNTEDDYLNTKYLLESAYSLKHENNVDDYLKWGMKSIELMKQNGKIDDMQYARLVNGVCEKEKSLVSKEQYKVCEQLLKEGLSQYKESWMLWSAQAKYQQSIGEQKQALNSCTKALSFIENDSSAQAKYYKQMLQEQQIELSQQSK